MTTLALIIGIILLTISAMSKAVMDTIRNTLTTSIFKHFAGNYFVDPEVSWMNKYKNHDPKQGERFPGSTTIFVSFTDLWHLSQHTYLLTLFVCFPVYALVHPIIHWLWYVTDFALIYAYFTCMFSLFYWIFNKK